MIGYYDMVEDYLSGSLSKEERQSMEIAMSHDPDLAALVQHYDSVRQVSNRLLDIDMRKTIDSLKTKERPNNSFSGTKPRWSWLLAAAAITVLLVSAYFMRDYQQKQTSIDRALAVYVKPADEESTTRSRGGSSTSDFEKGKNYFALRNYDLAIITLEQALRSTDERDTLLYWLGSAYLEQGDLSKALHTWGQSDHPAAQASISNIESIITQ